MSSDPNKTALGKSITARQFQQDMKFYDEILATNDRVKSDRAVSDMMNSSRIPVVRLVEGLDQTATQQCLFPPLKPYDGALTKKKDTEFDSRSAANSAYSAANTNKNSLASAANKSRDSSTVYSESLAKEEEQRRMISEAFEWLQKARSRVDPATCYFEAAKIFNAQQMGDRAICYFLRSLEQVSSVEVVDQLLLPDTDAHRRKLSRLSQGNLRAYIKEHKRKRDVYILEDEQRQFQRVQSSHIELFRLYMLDQFRDVAAAHRHLLEAFRVCDQLVPDPIVAESPDLEAATKGPICDWRGHADDEYQSSKYKHGPVKESEEDVGFRGKNKKIKSGPTSRLKGSVRAGASQNSVDLREEQSGPPARILGDGWRVRNNTLRYAHNILKTYVSPDKPETSIQNHILRESAGPLAEAHVVILRELLALYPHNAEYAHFMGMRYAEKCDFVESHRYFQLAREIQDPTPADLPTVLEQRLSRSTNTERHLSSFLSYTSKKELKEFGYDVDKDQKRLAEMKDFTNFLGKHEGTKTILFIPPESGWVSGVAEKQKAKERSQSTVLGSTDKPPVI